MVCHIDFDMAVCDGGEGFKSFVGGIVLHQSGSVNVLCENIVERFLLPAIHCLCPLMLVEKFLWLKAMTVL